MYSIVFLISKIASKEGKLYNFIESKRSSFFWAGCNDFFNEIYLNMTFAFFINAEKFDMSSSALITNNVYALVYGALLVFWPLTISIKLCRGWRKERKSQ